MILVSQSSFSPFESSFMMPIYRRPVYQRCGGRRRQTSNDDDVTQKQQNNSKPQEDKEEKIVLRRGPLELIQTKQALEFALEIPGVKHENVSVSIEDGDILVLEAERNAGRPFRWKKSFELDADRLAVTNTTANLLDGILTVTIPTKEYQESSPQDVAVTVGEHGSESSTKAVGSLDLPGVKQADVELKYHQGHLVVKALRKDQGVVVSKIQRVLTVDPKKYQVDSLEAFLSSGVLEVLASERKATPTLQVSVGISDEDDEPDVSSSVVETVSQVEASADEGSAAKETTSESESESVETPNEPQQTETSTNSPTKSDTKDAAASTADDFLLL